MLTFWRLRYQILLNRLNQILRVVTVKTMVNQYHVQKMPKFKLLKLCHVFHGIEERNRCRPLVRLEVLSQSFMRNMMNPVL